MGKELGEIWENWNPFSVARFPEKTADETWHEERTLADEGRDGVERQRFHDLGGGWLETSETSIHGDGIERGREVAFICSWKTKAEQQGLRSLFITLDGGCVPLLASCHLRHPSNRRSS